MTWDQVEAFFTRKLRRGRLLSMRVPFVPERNDLVTLGLELPNHLVMAIDGTVTQVGPAEAGKTAVELNLHGMTAELISRLRALVAEGREAPEVHVEVAPAGHADAMPSQAEDVSEVVPMPERDAVTATDVPHLIESSSELSGPARDLYAVLDGELHRMRELAAHEVLGVPWDASPAAVRTAWISLGRRFHPDVVARHHSPLLQHFAQEIAIHVNRAYDRMRAALVADGRASALGPALQAPRGWLVGVDDPADGDDDPEETDPVTNELDAVTPPVHTPVTIPLVRFQPSPEPLREEDLFGDLALEAADGEAEVSLPGGVAAGEAFEQQARQRLAAGDHAAAREILAAALHSYPRSNTLRALYHVASAMDALDGGQAMLATSQLEAALAQDPDCREAAAALDALRRRAADGSVLRRLFR